MDQFAVILPAAGRSVRFGRGRSKLLEDLAGQPVIRRSVQAFMGRADVCRVIVATPPDSVGDLSDALGEIGRDPRMQLCPGGNCRAQSVRNALCQVPSDVNWVAIHDAARPLASQALIDGTFAAARQYGAAVPALPVTLTIKLAAGPLPAPVQRTLPRHTLWAMQTPQAMRRDQLVAAFDSCPLPLDQITDDAQVLELAGLEVWLVEGEDRNLKITTPGDLHIAKTLLANGCQI